MNTPRESQETYNELRRNLARKCLEIAEEHYIKQILAETPEEAGHHLGMQNKWHSRAKKYVNQLK